jgi:cell division transport system ATP-binding protein
MAPITAEPRAQAQPDVRDVSPPLPAPLVELTGVTRRYGKLVALKDVSLSIAAGEFVFVTGPSEAGKTTLLKLIHGDVRPSGGCIRVAQYRLERRWRRFLPRLRRRVAAVFQDHRLLHDMTARANVAFALQVSDLGLPRREVHARAQTRLGEVGLGSRPGSYPHQLSGGQQRRLAIARALVSGPVLLLADEPTASLDKRNAGRVIELLERCCQAGTTVVVATHDIELVRTRPHRVIELHEGRIVADRAATTPILSDGAAATRVAQRNGSGPGLRARVAGAARLALGYTPPPPAAPSQKPRKPHLSLRVRAGRTLQVALGYRPVGPHTDGAWQPPNQVAQQLRPNGQGSGSAISPVVAREPPPQPGGAWRPPPTVAALAAVKPVDVNGGTNSRGLAKKLQVRVRVARISQMALGYQPVPAVPRETVPRLAFRARAARLAQFALGYKPPPRRQLRVTHERPLRRRPWIPLLNLGRLSVGGAITSWVRNFGTVAPALGSIAMLLVVAGVLTVGGFALRTVLVTQSREASVLHVYLSDDAGSGPVDEARASLTRQPHVVSVQYVDKDQALAQARRRPGLADLATASDSNPFPASLEVHVDQPSNVAGVAKVAATQPGVDTRTPTSYDPGIYDRLHQFTLVAAAVAGGFGLLMLAVTYGISSNSIRAAVLARRDELITMQLVGASRWLIRGRLGVEGGLTGALAGLIASGVVVGVCVASYFGARHLFVQLLPGVTASTAGEVVAGVAVAGMAIGSVSALFAFRRLRM